VIGLQVASSPAAFCSRLKGLLTGTLVSRVSRGHAILSKTAQTRNNEHSPLQTSRRGASKRTGVHVIGGNRGLARHARRGSGCRWVGRGRLVLVYCFGGFLGAHYAIKWELLHSAALATCK
jgi:hypothetical protein